MRLGRRSIVDEYRRTTRLHDKVAHQPPVGGIVAQHPAPAVNEHKRRKIPAPRPRRSDEVQAERMPFAFDRPFGLLDARQIDMHGRLHISQDATGLPDRQRFDGSAAVQHFQISFGSPRQVVVLQIIRSFLQMIHNKPF